MRTIFMPLILTCCLVQGACGTYIPSQRGWPHESSREVEDMNATLIHSVVCELSYAVTLAVSNDRREAFSRSDHKQYSDFLTKWGVEVATDLTVSDNGALNPNGVLGFNSIFSISTGINGAATSTNENKFNVFYKITDLYKPTLFKINSDIRPCRNPRGDQEGSPLVDIDLRILPLLESRIQVVQLGFANAPGPTVVSGEKNVLTQTVSIKEMISGEITPKWKFTTSSVNPTGKLFSAERDRTHQIVFTFGPLDEGKKGLTPLAEAFHINEQLKAGLRDIRRQL